MRHRAVELLVPVLLFVSPAGAESASTEMALRADVACVPLSGPGKVQCTVRERPIGGKLRWGDVIVLAAPPFAPPLRTRVASSDASRRDPEGADFALALAATADGVGELRVQARAVVCGEAGCRPVRAEASTRVAVGAAVDTGTD